MRMTLAARFWAKVKKSDGCWTWTGSRSQGGNGYGQIGSGGKRGPLLAAHRVSWELVSGPIPEGSRVLHRCDNRACVNPAHLFLGGQSENIVDMVKKGRCWNRKLTDADVVELRRLGALGTPSSVLAERFNITSGHARKVRSGIAAAHV